MSDVDVTEIDLIDYVSHELRNQTHEAMNQTPEVTCRVEAEPCAVLEDDWLGPANCVGLRVRGLGVNKLLWPPCSPSFSRSNSDCGCEAIQARTTESFSNSFRSAMLTPIRA